MIALILLISCSLIVAVAFLIGFLWSVSSGQYDDIYTPSIRMLFENELKNDQEARPDTTKENHESYSQSPTKKQLHP
ncbi:MAG: cbb3-type cytochrome oxidase assembly protein CcoS [Chitinophagaceae bacterium]|nr:cbb3-type cytochrome oxidase assembly protein CcoS [Chitinophagaceae bacterium]